MTTLAILVFQISDVNKLIELTLQSPDITVNERNLLVASYSTGTFTLDFNSQFINTFMDCYPAKVIDRDLLIQMGAQFTVTYTAYSTVITQIFTP